MGLIKVQVVPQPLGLTPLTVPAIALALCLGCGTGYAQERPADLAMGLFVDATTLWGQYQALIEVTIGVIVFQSALISGRSHSPIGKLASSCRRASLIC